MSRLTKRVEAVETAVEPRQDFLTTILPEGLSEDEEAAFIEAERKKHGLRPGGCHVVISAKDTGVL